MEDLLNRVKEELVPDLEDISESWESRYPDGENPDDYFQPLLELFHSLLDHFGDDQEIADSIEWEEKQVSRWIADNCQVWESEPDQREFDRVDEASGPESDRSIFDDIDEDGDPAQQEQGLTGLPKSEDRGNEP